MGVPDADPDGAAERVLMALLVRQRHSWEQALTASVLREAGRLDLLRVLADDAVAREISGGRLGELEDVALVNSAAVAEALLPLIPRHLLLTGSPDPSPGAPAGGTCEVGADEVGADAVGADAADGEEAAPWDGAAPLAEAVRQQRTWLLRDCPRAADGTVYHLGDRAEVWADTVYMVVPLLVALGEHDQALAQLAGHRRRLRDPASGLWTARWDEVRQRPADARAWGTANGWVLAALARSLRLLRLRVTALDAGPAADAAPASEAARTTEAAGATDANPTAPAGPDAAAALAVEARELADACLRRRRPDGLFGDVLDDPDSYRETNLAQMLAYTLLSGVVDGWLPGSYADVGDSLLADARAQVDPLGQVRGVPAAPRFDRPGTSPEGQAFALLAGAEKRRLAARAQAVTR